MNAPNAGRASIRPDKAFFPPAGSSERVWLWAVVYAAFFIVIICGPIGLSMMGMIEEWDILFLFKQSGIFYVVDAASPLPSHRIRPLMVFPYAVGYAWDDASFLQFHFIQFAALLLKAGAAAFVVNWISNSRRLAVVSGLIFLTYPADTMQMTFRSLSINWALALSVSAIALLLDSTGRRGWIQPIETAASALCFLAGSLMYEAGLFLAPLPLVIWWARFGWRDGLARLRSEAGAVAIFSLAVIVGAGYVIATALSGVTYQTSVTGDQLDTFKDIAGRVPYLFDIALYRLFVQGWYDGLRMLRAHLAFWPYLVAAAMVLTSVVFVFPARADAVQRRDALRLIMAGFIAAVLGYLPYLSSFFHVMTSQRTYLYAAFGATLQLAGILQIVTRVRPALAGAVVVFCLLSGLGSQWGQFAHYTALSNRQRMILSGILQAAPDAGQPGSKRLLVIDLSGSMSNQWMLRGVELRNALTQLYGTEVEPYVCTEPGLLFSSFISAPFGRPSTCVETANAWDIGVGLPQPIHLDKSDVRILTVHADGHVTGEGASPPEPSNAQLARWRGYLRCWPASACAYDIQDPDQRVFDYDFGRFWGLDDVPWGGGWREEEWRLPAPVPVSWSWVTAPEASLWFRIRPEAGRYVMRVRLYSWIAPQAKDSFRLGLNGAGIDAKWIDGQTVEAEFDGARLKNGINEIRLSAVQDPQNDLSIAVDRVTVGPLDRVR